MQINADLEKFKSGLAVCTDDFIIETARRQANSFVKEGSPYIAELLRDLCNRVERNGQQKNR